MTQICLTKKYGEFKNATDFERARHFLEINFTALSNEKISFDLFNYELWISRGKLQSPIPFKNCYVATFGRPSNSLKFSSEIYKVALAGMKRLNVTALPQFKQLVEGVKTIDGNNAESPPPYKTGVVDEIPVAKKDINNTFIKNTTAEIIASKLESSKLKPLYGNDSQTSIVVTSKDPFYSDSDNVALIKKLQRENDAFWQRLQAASAVVQATNDLQVLAYWMGAFMLSNAHALNTAPMDQRTFALATVGELTGIRQPFSVGGPIFAGGGNKRRPTLTRKRSSQSSSSLLLFTKRNRHPNHQSLKQKKRTIKKGSRKKRHNEMKKKKSIKKRV
jgi:hypothetical protein